MPETLKESFFKVLTVNCQGLGDSKKRKDVFMYLKAKHYTSNIYFLKDTHFTKQDENVIKSQWGSKILFSSFKPNSRGVAILVNDNCEFELFNMKQDEGGNYIILDVKIEDIPFLLINIYGPNNDTPIFFSTLISLIVDMYSSQHIILGGDFNLIFDKDMDSMNYKHLNNPKARLELFKLMDTLNVVEIFRINNPHLKRYTCREKNPLKQARLDFFLISESLQTMPVSYTHLTLPTICSV